jgi:hypothetical protein
LRQSPTASPPATAGTTANFAGTRRILIAYYAAAESCHGRTVEGCLVIDDLWYKNGVFYCLSVGTSMDANGDGVGDFKGLLRRL